MNSFEYRRLGIARMTAIIQQVKMVIKALFLVDLGKKGLTIARYLRMQTENQQKVSPGFVRSSHRIIHHCYTANDYGVYRNCQR